jgi:hypothetical protein
MILLDQDRHAEPVQRDCALQVAPCEQVDRWRRQRRGDRPVVVVEQEQPGAAATGVGPPDRLDAGRHRRDRADARLGARAAHDRGHGGRLGPGCL